MTDKPRWPEWMDQKVLAAYIGKKPSTVRTLLKHDAIPRPFKRGRVVLWNRRAVDLWLMRGGEGGEVAPADDVTALRQRMKRTQEEDKKFDLRYYRSIFDEPKGASDDVRSIRRRRQRRNRADSSGSQRD